MIEVFVGAKQYNYIHVFIQRISFRKLIKENFKLLKIILYIIFFYNNHSLQSFL